MDQPIVSPDQRIAAPDQRVASPGDVPWRLVCWHLLAYSRELIEQQASGKVCRLLLHEIGIFAKLFRLRR